MKQIMYIIILLLSINIVFAGLDIGLPDTLPVVSINNPDKFATLGGDNTFTGNQIYEYNLY